jgi:hypothetical protein
LYALINNEVKTICWLGWLCCLLEGLACQAQADSGSTAYIVAKTADFRVGKADDPNWKRAEWLVLPQRTFGSGAFETKVKALYSDSGMYFLFQCADRKLSATMQADFMDLWNEDVVEVFLWPYEAQPVYFEYEISPLNRELPILISNLQGDLVRWQPFHYDTDRRTQHATRVYGGRKESNASVTGWSAEFFIPFKLLRPLTNISPRRGTRWRTNFYRVDYDKGKSSWSWKLTRKNFHDYEKFGIMIFN